jgi:hypothetical protein
LPNEGLHLLLPLISNRLYTRNRVHYWMASATCAVWIGSDPAQYPLPPVAGHRSAMVRASLALCVRW